MSSLEDTVISNRLANMSNRSAAMRVGGRVARRNFLALALFGIAASADARAGWISRSLESVVPVYFESYHLPVLNAGPTDPAPSPDGRQLAFAARGWLWLLDLQTGTARRITFSGPTDSRPAWSPDGRRLAFVRDDTRDTALFVLELASGHEQRVLDEPALELDPAFSADGRFLYYSSAAGGDLNLWRLELATGNRTRLSDHRGAVLRPQVHPGAEQILYFLHNANGQWSSDEIRVHRLSDASERVLLAGDQLWQCRPALSPDGHTVAVNLPASGGAENELQLRSLETPGSAVILTKGLALTPAWSADGQSIYFTEADSQQRMVLKQVPYAGGKVTEVPIRRWDWGVPTARIRIRSGPARLGVLDHTGHPVIPEVGQPRLDVYHNAVYFYSSGTIELTVPAGKVQISAVRGLTTPLQVIQENVSAGQTREVEIKLEPLWDARTAGYVSGDHHLHLNYGGPYRLQPRDLLLPMHAEDLDVATPMLANHQNRLEDPSFWNWQQLPTLPFVHFAQEVRSHFFGHVGLIGTKTLFQPWFWGPEYEVYRRDDRLNADALRHARREGGVNVYVHPHAPPPPPSLVPDIVLGEVDAFELSGIADAYDAADVWYPLLNLGIPVALSAGPDVFVNAYRNWALGTARIYVRTAEPFRFEQYLRDLKAGHSFVTNGPLLDFRVAQARPGEVLNAHSGPLPWRLELYSAVPVEKVELLVNGAVIWQGNGLGRAGKKSFSGRLEVPAQGWIAVRAHGGKATAWPAMSEYPFAHTGPIWIGSRGSTLASAKQKAATELLPIVNAAELQLREAYEGAQIPRLMEHFAKARAVLQSVASASVPSQKIVPPPKHD